MTWTVVVAVKYNTLTLQILVTCGSDGTEFAGRAIPHNACNDYK